jgi:hypothetical protein
VCRGERRKERHQRASHPKQPQRSQKSLQTTQDKREAFVQKKEFFLEFSKYHMYADNLLIYHSRPREMLFECIHEVNSSRVFECVLANSLKLNFEIDGAANIQKLHVGSSSSAFSWRRFYPVSF